MKRTILLSIFAMAIIGLSAQTKTFKGGFFEIKYPAAFTAKGSLVSETAGDGSFDSAFFTSPDGDVEFYVFSPQWSGSADDIEVQPNEIKGKEEYTKGKNTVIIRYTITAKNGSYARSYQETRNRIEKTTTIIGIKYKNMKAYNKYKKEYLAFKASLVQFADN